MAVATPRRRYATRLPREERREQVLDAALAVIARDGWGSATMERVAAEAKIAKSVLYAQFGSQAGMLDALMRREQDRAFALVASALFSEPADPDPVLMIRQALDTFLDGVSASPDTWRLVLMPSAGTPPAVRDAIEDGRERWRRELEPIARQILPALGLAALDTELVTHVARSNAEMLARLILEQRFSRERIAGFTDTVAGEILALLGSRA
jgi:AcrR family transcriptional regulator